MVSKLAALGLTAVLILLPAAQAKVYKWVDAQGRVHYTARPPADAQAEEVKVRAAPPTAVPDKQTEGEPVKASGEAPATPKSEDPVTGAAAREARMAALRKNCEIVRNNMAILQDPTLRRVSEPGKEGVFLSDEQRQEKLAKLREQEKEYCI